MAKTATKQDVVKQQKESTLAMTKEQQKKIDELQTVSARIRYLDAQGYTRSQITKLIPNASGDKLRYQHVRGVLTSQAPKNAS